ncbi:MAG: hypothetical protein EBT86_10825 [Actinobacteria bacterium]|nr:hypothetical protein [Actinomycetota bacterium]
MYTIIVSDYNEYPGRPATKYRIGYNFETGSEPPVLPTVNLNNSFSFSLGVGVINSYTPSTLSNNYSGYAKSGVRNGVTPKSTKFGYASNFFVVNKRITNVEWVSNSGPQKNAVAQNELGDWFTYEALTTSDASGTGIRLEIVAPSPATGDYTIITDTDDDSSSYIDRGIILPGGLKISGSYNSAVFCRNQFDYTNDDKGTVFTAKSLYELPEKFDNLVSFIPDQRQSTTLTYKVAISWDRIVDWKSSPFTTNQKNSILSKYDNNDFGSSGVDIHTITHKINNNNTNLSGLLQSTLRRQRTLEEQDIRYGQTFPKLNINIVPG